MLSAHSSSNSAGRFMAILAAFLGWMFDGMEMGIFPLVAKQALSSTGLPDAGINLWMSWITASFLVGAALGGFLFGWLGDRIGRVRAMTASILVYSLVTGLCYFAQAPWHLALCRFIAALGMGGEWALGVALVMEVWPEAKRPLMAALIGAAANLGYCFVALVKISFTITDWRQIMIIGAAPALLTFFIRLFVPESEKWQHAAVSKQRIAPQEIFGPSLRRRTFLAVAFASIALIVTWGTVQWIPLWADSVVGKHDRFAGAWGQFFSALGATVGCAGAPYLCQWLGRRFAYFWLCVIALVVCQVFYRRFDPGEAGFRGMAFAAGAATASFYGWLPLYLPELFPTRVRATGQGVAFNSGRILAAIGTVTVAGPISANKEYATAGVWISLIYLAGMALIWLAPETKGRPLPD